MCSTTTISQPTTPPMTQTSMAVRLAGTGGESNRFDNTSRTNPRPALKMSTGNTSVNLARTRTAPTATSTSTISSMNHYLPEALVFLDAVQPPLGFNQSPTSVSLGTGIFGFYLRVA